MGITAHDIKLLEKALEIKPDIKSVIELGYQNLYLPDTDPHKPPFAHTWYEARGIQYAAIDLAETPGPIKRDLSKVLKLVNQPGSPFVADLVTDFGTSEHIVANTEMHDVSFHEGHIHSVYPSGAPTEQNIKEGFYHCWVNKHDLLMVDGVMINVNPKTGNWPDHGYTYLTVEFYGALAELMGYELILLEEDPAMGNTTSGWNICCILRKKDDRPFISFEDFQQCEQLRA